MSNNIFQEVLTNAKAAEEKYIGPDYPYYKYIKTPSEIGMSGKGKGLKIERTSHTNFFLAQRLGRKSY